jgi:hypothetical protein
LIDPETLSSALRLYVLEHIHLIGGAPKRAVGSQPLSGD